MPVLGGGDDMEVFGWYFKWRVRICEYLGANFWWRARIWWYLGGIGVGVIGVLCWRTVLLYILTHIHPHVGQSRGFKPARGRVRTIRSEYSLDSHNINYLATTMIKLPNWSSTSLSDSPTFYEDDKKGKEGRFVVVRDDEKEWVNWSWFSRPGTQGHWV